MHFINLRQLAITTSVDGRQHHQARRRLGRTTTTTIVAFASLITSAMAALIDKENWFAESEVMWPGQRFSLKVGEVLHHSRSAFQDILVFQSETYGRVLVLDGVIQLTERDEFAYQEMIAHLPLLSHPEPKRVLIVGGGDGGVLREVARHACVETIDMCEIDAGVVEVSKRFFAESTATAYGDARLTLVHADAAAYLRTIVGGADDGADLSDPAIAAALARRQTPGGWPGYDVIIVDSSDPVGPAETLFEPAFYDSMRAALAPGGAVCTQGECMWLHLPLISKVVSACRDLFPTVEYAYTCVPTYPSGQIGFIMCSLDESRHALVKPVRAPVGPLQDQLRYYSPDVHAAAFVLPPFAERELRK